MSDRGSIIREARASARLDGETRVVDPDLRTICRRAVDLWGAASQLRQLQEECGELVAAVNQADRGRDGAIGQLIEEVADVEIMIAQARHPR